VEVHQIGWCFPLRSFTPSAHPAKHPGVGTSGTTRKNESLLQDARLTRLGMRNFCLNAEHVPQSGEQVEPEPGTGEERQDR
jgi:hypothetical protein